jgi:hypothetical protein
VAKAVRFHKKSQADFSRLFSELCKSKSPWEAWADFTAMSALVLANAFDQQGPIHDDRERQYADTVKRYSKSELSVFSKLFAVTVEALEDDPDQDFLGEMFMGLNLSSHWKGQFFTPYNVCRMTAEMQIDGIEAHIERRGWVGINDPCCGAGALLVAARNALVRRKLGPTQALFVAQDIDRTAALMCYVQLSLLGCAGYVVVADSIRYPITGPRKSPLLISPMPEQEVWLMPALYNEIWAGRTQCERMMLLLEQLEAATQIAHEPEPDETPQIPEALAQPTVPLLNEKAGGQFTLF